MEDRTERMGMFMLFPPLHLAVGVYDVKFATPAGTEQTRIASFIIWAMASFWALKPKL